MPPKELLNTELFVRKILEENVGELLGHLTNLQKENLEEGKQPIILRIGLIVRGIKSHHKQVSKIASRKLLSRLEAEIDRWETLQRKIEDIEENNFLAYRHVAINFLEKVSTTLETTQKLIVAELQSA